jgi:hypothetical protein
MLDEFVLKQTLVGQCIKQFCLLVLQLVSFMCVDRNSIGNVQFQSRPYVDKRTNEMSVNCRSGRRDLKVNFTGFRVGICDNKPYECSESQAKVRNCT